MTRARVVPLQLVAWCLAAWALAAPPAAAELYVYHDRLFAGVPATVLVYGSVGHEISGYEPPVITPHEVDSYYNADRIELSLTRYSASSYSSRFAYRVDIPDPKAGISHLVVKLKDGEVLFDAAILVESEIEVIPSRTFLTEAETLRVRTRFSSSFGELGETVEVVDGKIRLKLAISCHLFCPIPFPTTQYELESAPLGPFPAGEYQLELWSENLEGGGTLLYQEKVVVVPEQARLRGGRFVVDVPLDPPHGFSARLAAPPSADSALFYFFNRENWELMVKVLDGCAINGHYWVFGAASTDVGHTVIVRDTTNPARVREYRHAAGAPAPAIADIQAFACNPGDPQ